MNRFSVEYNNICNVYDDDDVDVVCSHRLFVVDVDPVEFADDDEVKPDSNCRWPISLLCCLRRLISKIVASSDKSKMPQINVVRRIRAPLRGA